MAVRCKAILHKGLLLERHWPFFNDLRLQHLHFCFGNVNQRNFLRLIIFNNQVIKVVVSREKVLTAFSLHVHLGPLAVFKDVLRAALRRLLVQAHLRTLARRALSSDLL